MISFLGLVWGFLKSAPGKFTIGILIVVAAFIYGSHRGKEKLIQVQNVETVKEVVKYVERREKVIKKYNNPNRFTDECILGGCLPETLKHQPHCEACDAKAGTK